MSENKTKAAAQEFMAEVSHLITTDASTEVRSRLTEHYYNEEVNSRVQLLIKAFAKHKDLSRNLNKVNRPDNTLKDVDGQVVQSLYTDARLKEIENARKPLTKLETAMQNALENNDFKKLKEAL